MSQFFENESLFYTQALKLEIIKIKEFYRVKNIRAQKIFQASATNRILF